MLKNQKPVIMWVPQATRATLKQIARDNGEQLYQTVDRLAQAAAQQLPGTQQGK